MAGREEMLERIRKALGRPPGTPRVIPEGVARSPQELAGVMPAITPEELLPKFEEELAKVAGASHRAATLLALEQILRGILAGSGATRVVISRNPLLGQLGIRDKLCAWGKRFAEWPAPGAYAEGAATQNFREECLQAEVGITGVDFALSETGSLVLSSMTEGSQLASLAPPVHVALYRRSQLVASLDEVLERLPVSRNPDQATPGRSVVFVTGTSRTADIEQILIRGVHGPREVHAILVEDSCLE